MSKDWTWISYSFIFYRVVVWLSLSYNIYLYYHCKKCLFLNFLLTIFNFLLEVYCYDLWKIKKQLIKIRYKYILKYKII